MYEHNYHKMFITPIWKKRTILNDTILKSGETQLKTNGKCDFGSYQKTITQCVGRKHRMVPAQAQQVHKTFENPREKSNMLKAPSFTH